MKAMILKNLTDLTVDRLPLHPSAIPLPVPGNHDLLLKVAACGVCHTELDEIEGRTPPPRFPVIPGHQVVGTVTDRGASVTRFSPGDRVGVGWIFSSCGRCPFCREGRDNL